MAEGDATTIAPPKPRRTGRWLWAAAALTLAVAAAVVAAAWQERRPERRFARALAALDAKQFDRVAEELADLEGVPGFEPQRHFLRGALLLHAGQRYPALEEFGHTVEVPALRVRTLTLSGQALYEARQLPAAVNVLRQAVAADPKAVEAHRWLASAYYDLGLNDDTLAHLQRIAELDPADPRPHRLMGLIQKDFENYSGAVASYQESLRRDPQQPHREAVFLELAACQIKLQQNEDALRTLAEAQPSPDRWASEAECHYRAGRAEEAKRLVEQALAADPVHLQALLLKGTILLDGGRVGEAAEVFAQAVVGYPKDYVARQRLIQAYRQLGDTDRVAEQAAIADNLKRLREEFSKLHETAAAEPQNADVRCRLGVLALELDRADLARVWFQAALAIDPKHAETLRCLGQTGETGSDKK